MSVCLCLSVFFVFVFVFVSSLFIFLCLFCFFVLLFLLHFLPSPLAVPIAHSRVSSACVVIHARVSRGVSVLFVLILPCFVFILFVFFCLFYFVCVLLFLFYFSSPLVVPIARLRVSSMLSFMRV